MALSTEPDTVDYCELTDYMLDEKRIIGLFDNNLDNVRAVVVTLCQWRFQLQRIVNRMGDHSMYCLMLFLSRYHWRISHTARVREERIFVKKLFSRKVSASDWSRCMKSAKYMTLLSGSHCARRYGILGVILIDKEISKSRNYLKMLARMEGRTFDARMLHYLFESRINYRLLLTLN